MKIDKDTLLQVKSSRKGNYKAIALKDFDTEDEWYPVALAENKAIVGMNKANLWIAGDEVPCRKGLNTVEIIK
jgi:hypothetical protein